MMIWLLSDTHLGHDKMVEYCGRPADHSDIILNNLSTMVRDDDILIHLGDVCIGKDNYWHELLDAACDKVFRILIRGNHDKKSLQWYITHGWNICEPDMLMSYKGKRIYFTHEPRRKIPGADFNIHGHMHNNAHRMDAEMKKWYDPAYHKLLAIENTDLKPVLLDDFIAQ